MRLLWARVGRAHCPVCGEEITKQTPQQIVDALLKYPERTPFAGSCPRGISSQGEFVDLFKDLVTQGYSRARVAENSSTLGSS